MTNIYIAILFRRIGLVKGVGIKFDHPWGDSGLQYLSLHVDRRLAELYYTYYYLISATYDLIVTVRV